MWRASALLAWSLTTACAAHSLPSQVPQPELLFTITPRGGVMSQFSTRADVTAVLRINRPSPELRCANPVWTWPDGAKGNAEDCVPEELEPWPPGKQRVVTLIVPMREAGTIRVELCRWVSDRSECIGRMREAHAEFVLLTAGEE